MRQPRLKIPPGTHGPAIYHCVSRVVDRRFAFEEAEKDRFVALLRECARFCRVRVLTYCILSNHFHILVEVPPRPAAESLPTPEEIVRDLRRLSGHQFPGSVAQRFEALREAGDETAAAAYLSTFHSRMWDVSAFIKLLKQRFTQWYNAHTNRRGTLWEQRFKSLLVEGLGEAVTAMAAYIDLNPVRARLVMDPSKYAWSGFGGAVAGDREAIDGLRRVVQCLDRGPGKRGIRDALGVYRRWLALKGDERLEGTDAKGQSSRGAIPEEAVTKVLKDGGRVGMGQYLRCRVRYFSDGLALGGKEWIEELFQAERARFGPKRKTGARRMRGLTDLQLFSMRDLQKRVFG